MAGFEEHGTASRMREVIRRIVVDILNKERPPYRYGIVSSIDRANYKCSVYFDNDSANPVTVKMGSLQPSATGQRVRVAGKPGDRYIDDVMGTAYSASTSMGDVAWNVIGSGGQPAFVGAWVNYGGAYSTAAFRKLSNGQVILRGLIKSGATGGAVIFTLPAGYRPGALTALGAASNLAGATAVGELDITATGDLKWYGQNAPAWLALDGLSFFAEG